jgi:hypothetical protein
MQYCGLRVFFVETNANVGKWETFTKIVAAFAANIHCSANTTTAPSQAARAAVQFLRTAMASCSIC